MRLGVFSAIVVMALPLAAGDVAAQGRGRGQGRENIRFQGMDRNGDGEITQDEWRGSAQSFRVHDWNHDGRLSGDEVRPGAQRNVNRDEYDYNAERAGEFDDWTSEGFAYLDHNRDGRLSREEWHYDIESFVRADRNRDNVLSRDEFLGGDNIDLDRNDRFEYLDTNNNGRVERGEWHGDTSTFERLDRNNDGWISRYEMRGQNQGAGDRAESDLFASLDYNHDNRISQDEWHWSRRSFLQQDTNRDGSVSRDEFSDPNSPEAGAAGTSGAIGRPVVVNVNADRQWVDTGIDVRAGDVLTIRADGTVRLSGNGNDTATPGGGNRRANNASMPNHPAGALIARVGSGAPIFVGDGRGIARLTTGGRLYLGVNDDHWDDNSGQFRATVTVRRQ